MATSAAVSRGTRQVRHLDAQDPAGQSREVEAVPARRPQRARHVIVSRECVYDHVFHLAELRTKKRTKTRIPEEQKKGGKLTVQYVDEEDLLRELFATASDRRYVPEIARSSRIMSSLAHAEVNLSLG